VSTTGKTALLLAADLFEDSELLYPLYRLAEEDVAVTVAGVDDRRSPARRGTARWRWTPLSMRFPPRTSTPW